MLRAGIVGLPNCGKSTLFNAVTRTHKAAVAPYPFCTIEPNVGVVAVQDGRLDELARVFRVPKQIPATIEYFDIAGLVKGASQGEGLGNQFLSHIREVDALVQVVRCFEDADVPHSMGTLDPVRDIEVVLTELVIADLEAVRRRHEKLARDLKRGDKQALAEEAVLQKLEPHLGAGKPALTLKLFPEERALARQVFLLTDKPTVFAVNVSESDLANAATHPRVAQVRQYAAEHHGCDAVVISAKLESDLADLAPDEARDYLAELGVATSGVTELVQHTYTLLRLRTFFTHNENEVRAWTVAAGCTAPKAAGCIHTDFERGFIKAEVVKCQDVIACGSVAHARETGRFRIEGRDYEVADGDVIHFKFHA
jgi:hypothetical protein